MQRVPYQLAIGLLLVLGCATPPRATLPASAPPTGTVHDFDYFEGGWTTTQRRRTAGTWDEFPATLCMRRYLDGTVNAGELVFPTQGWAGVTVRAFDAAQRRWAIYWISSRTGRLGAPMRGGFTGDRGEFHGTDEEDGQPVELRTTWHKRDRDHARWEQASSRDGRTWQVNWTADFTRAAAVCRDGRPVVARPAIATPAGDDFAYFAGGWTTRQRRLAERGVGSTAWEEFPATLCMTPYLDGLVTIDELAFPTKGWAGFTVRAFDVAARRWSIYWISSRTGTLGAPVVGAFEGARGEFLGEDEDGGHPVKVRYAWHKLDRDHARWDQAFARDGQAWETNWIADFERADAARVCAAGRPRP